MRLDADWPLQTGSSSRGENARPRQRRIGEFFKRKTLMFNGYADQVASLYTRMDLRKNF